MPEKRRETRYSVPEIYKELITLKIKKDPDEFVAAKLLNISLSGIKTKDPFTIAVGAIIECLISIPDSTIKERPFSARLLIVLRVRQTGTISSVQRSANPVNNYGLTCFLEFTIL